RSGRSTAPPAASGRPPCDPGAPAGSSPPGAGWCLCTSSARPFFTDPVVEPVGESIQVLLALADRLGIAAHECGDRRGAPMAEHCGLDGRIPPAVLLRERVMEHPHRVLDLGAGRHGWASVARS